MATLTDNIKFALIPNIVFPIISATRNEREDLRYEQLLGTGFFVGGEGLALTARHVLKDVNQDKLFALLISRDRKWVSDKIEIVSLHDTEDVGAFCLKELKPKIDIFPCKNKHFPPASYRQWGALSQFEIPGFRGSVV